MRGRAGAGGGAAGFSAGWGAGAGGACCASRFKAASNTIVAPVTHGIRIGLSDLLVRGFYHRFDYRS